MLLRIRSILLVCLLLGAFSLGRLNAAYEFSFTTLSISGATGSTYALGISGNNIVGYSDAGSYLYDGLSVTTISDPSATVGTFARGVSGSTVVGYYNNPAFTSHGFSYNGSYTNLNYPGATGSTVAYGIDGNTLVGYYNNSASPYQGFIYNGVSFTTFNVPAAGGYCKLPLAWDKIK